VPHLPALGFGRKAEPAVGGNPKTERQGEDKKIKRKRQIEDLQRLPLMHQGGESGPEEEGLGSGGPRDRQLIFDLGEVAVAGKGRGLGIQSQGGGEAIGVGQPVFGAKLGGESGGSARFGRFYVGFRIRVTRRPVFRRKGHVPEYWIGQHEVHSHQRKIALIFVNVSDNTLQRSFCLDI
jgi:hypothetical protein